MNRQCPVCRERKPEKGRAMDGRRAYRCACCGVEWTDGLQGVSKNYTPQRQGNQFANTGAYKSCSFDAALKAIGEEP